MKQHESAILAISDVHLGKVTSSYNPEVCAERFNNLNQRLTRIRELLSGYQMDELVVLLLGDIVDGSGIYPTQTHHQILSNSDEQAEIIGGILKPLLLEQRRNWKSIRVECVPGNHGRSGKGSHESENFDIIAYKYLQKDLAAKGITVNIETESDPFVRKIEVRGHHYIIYHGMDIRSFASIPWYGMALRLSRWAITKKLGRFDAAIMGHFHSFGSWQINQLRVFMTGTMVSDDDWALRTLGWESVARWWLFGVSNKFPVTWQFGLDLI